MSKSERREETNHNDKSIMSPRDEVITGISGAKELGSGKGDKFYLFLTNSRLVSIWMSSHSVGFWLGPAMWMIEQVDEKRLFEDMKARLLGQSLDTLLSINNKNYQIALDSVHYFGVKWKLMGSKIEIRYGTGQRKKYAVSTESVKELFDKLPNIKLLEGKLSFSVENSFHRDL